MQIYVDQEIITPLNNLWLFGGNTCHASLWLRDDLLSHVQLAGKELHFKYVRAHGLLNDDMVSVCQDGEYDFSRCITAIKRILGCGLRPFIELSSMPASIAKKKTSICKYSFMTSPPRNWDLWRNLVSGFLNSLVDAFDRSEVAQWYFEIWNEPDITFWSGSREEYFKLYDIAANAIKTSYPEFRVGGPATSKTAWIDEFLLHVGSASEDDDRAAPRCDFISTHAYPSDCAFLDGDIGDVKLQRSNVLPELFRNVRNKMDKMVGVDIPLFIGEWNSSAGPLAFNHDDCNNAAFIAQAMIDLMPYCQGSLYWNISDIYEECGFHYEPFHGGYGLLTVNDLPKASFHAFRLLSLHQGCRLGVCTDDGACYCALASKDTRNIRVLLWNYIEPDAEKTELDINLCIGGKNYDAYPVYMRYLNTSHGTYFYLANLLWSECQVKIEVSSSCLIEDLSSGQMLTSSANKRYALNLKPYQLRSFYVKGTTNLRLTGHDIVVPENIKHYYADKIRAFESAIGVCEKSGEDVAGMTVRLGNIKNLVNSGSFAEAHRLVFSKRMNTLLRLKAMAEKGHLQKKNSMIAKSIYRVNCGQTDYCTDDNDELYLPDQPYNGTYGYVGKYNSANRGIASIDPSASNRRLYASEAYDIDGYSFKVQPGVYQVKLYFKVGYEPNGCLGKNIINLDIENESVLQNFDVFEGTRRDINKVFVKTVNRIEVKDGILDIRFSVPEGIHPSVRFCNGIEIIPAN